MLIALFLIILWPVAEMLVAIEIASAIGFLAMLVLLILSWPLGTWALRREGRIAWRRLGAAVQEGRPPGREVIDGALVVLGGVLLIIPGFITDALGLLMLIAPTRSLIRAGIVRNFQSRVLSKAFRFTTTRGYDVDSTAHDVDPSRLHR